MLSFYSMNSEGDIDRAVKLIRSRIMNLQTFDWKKLVVIIEQFRSLKSE
jgi:hypothetical protein